MTMQIADTISATIGSPAPTVPIAASTIPTTPTSPATPPTMTTW